MFSFHGMEVARIRRLLLVLIAISTLLTLVKSGKAFVQCYEIP